MNNLNFYTTNDKWEVVKLKHALAHSKAEELDQRVVFKQLHVESCAVHLQNVDSQERVRLLKPIPIDMNLTIKKNAKHSIAGVQVDIQIHEIREGLSVDCSFSLSLSLSLRVFLLLYVFYVVFCSICVL